MSLPRPTRQLPQDNTTNSIVSDLSNDLRPSDLFRFEPKDDITIEELGYLVSVFWTLDVNYNRFSQFDEDLQRHFCPIRD